MMMSLFCLFYLKKLFFFSQMMSVIIKFLQLTYFKHCVPLFFILVCKKYIYIKKNLSAFDMKNVCINKQMNAFYEWITLISQKYVQVHTHTHIQCRWWKDMAKIMIKNLLICCESFITFVFFSFFFVIIVYVALLFARTFFSC